MLKREVVKPRSLLLETIAIVVALGSLMYVTGCLDEVETPQPDPVKCCAAYPGGFGLEGCVKDAIGESESWTYYDRDAYGCVSFTCPPVPDGVRWTTRVCP